MSRLLTLVLAALCFAGCRSSRTNQVNAEPVPQTGYDYGGQAPDRPACEGPDCAVPIEDEMGSVTVPRTVVGVTIAFFFTFGLFLGWEAHVRNEGRRRARAALWGFPDKT